MDLKLVKEKLDKLNDLLSQLQSKLIELQQKRTEMYNSIAAEKQMKHIDDRRKQLLNQKDAKVLEFRNDKPKGPKQ